MRRSVLRPYLTALLPGLMLTACGGAPEADLAAPPESLGVQESALCSGLSVTSLTISGISTYQGEMAGSGTWALSSGANAVRLEYYVDGTLLAVEERTGRSGTWYFSMPGVTCGTRTFLVKAFPMVIDSTGSRTTCLSGTLSASRSVTESCPALAASLTCSRTSTYYVRCTGSATGGSGSYTAYWQDWEYGRAYGWYQSTMAKSFYCLSSTTQGSIPTRYDFKVIDTNGVESNVVSRSFSCGIDLR